MFFTHGQCAWCTRSCLPPRRRVDLSTVSLTTCPVRLRSRLIFAFLLGAAIIIRRVWSRARPTPTERDYHGMEINRCSELPSSERLKASSVRCQGEKITPFFGRLLANCMSAEFSKIIHASVVIPNLVRSRSG